MNWFKRFVGYSLALVFPFAKIYWRLARPNTFGVRVVIVSDNKLLLIKNTYIPYLWTFPGGGVKKNESPRQAACREIKEEVGLSLTQLKNHGCLLLTYLGKNDTVWVFSTRIPSPVAHITDPLEIADIKWVSLDQIAGQKVAISADVKDCLRLIGLPL